VSISAGDSNPTVGSAIRLNGGNNTSGRLEVSLDGDKSWGCVCGLHFDHLSAHVACRQLGFDTAVGYHYTELVMIDWLVNPLIHCDL
jgi:deleted-in-malignant-brain-tumors protein 1